MSLSSPQRPKHYKEHKGRYATVFVDNDVRESCYEDGVAMKPCELHRSRRSRSSLEFPYYRATVTSLRPHFPRTVLHRGLISMPGFAIVHIKGPSLTVEVTSAHRVAASNGNGRPFFVYLGKLTAQRVYATLSVVKAEGMSARRERTKVLGRTVRRKPTSLLP